LRNEKALKALIVNRTKKNPPKTHDINYLYTKAEPDISEDFASFLDDMNTVSVLTRYPEMLEDMLIQYDEDRVLNVVKNTEAMLEWLQKRLTY
jgi:HEPN domain-containing protein